MSRAETKSVIAEVIRLLSKDRLAKFCFYLLDRRDDPRFARADLGDQSVETISDLLVSKFSPAKAVEVTVDLLRDVTCNSAADMLESRTRALLDKGNPTFRRTSAGELVVQPSQEALISHTPMQSSVVPVKTAQEVEAEAKNRVRSEGGCTEGDGSTVLVLSRYTLQFGKYRGQTFKWLLENDLQYAAFIITDHDDEIEGLRNGRQNHLTSGPLMDNKRSLRKYAMVFREFRKVRSLQLAQNGNARVAFGKYKQVKLKKLYLNPSRRSYVDFLRRRESQCTPGSLMEIAVDYILHCDRHGVCDGHAPASHSTGVANYPTRGRNRQQTRFLPIRSRRGKLR